MRWLRSHHALAATWAIVCPWTISAQENTAVIPTQTLTFQASLERALTNNPRLLAAQKDMAIAKAQIRQAKSLFYPKVNMGLSYIRYRNETLGLVGPDLGDVVLEAPITGPEGERSNPLAENLYVGRLGFRQPLYAGGRNSTTYKLSQANLKRSESSYEALRKEVEFETKEAFLRLVALKAKIDEHKKASAQIEKLAAQASSLHTQLSLATLAADLRKQLSELVQEEQHANYDYLQVMGMELFTPVKVDGEIAPPRLPPLQTALTWAKQNRAELKVTQIQEETDRLSVSLSMAERYPVFLLGGGVEVRKEKFPLDESNWHAGLSMNIPIFDGFSSRGRIKESRYRVEQGRFSRAELEDLVEREVRSAHGDYLHWVEELAMRNVELKKIGSLENRRDGVSLAERADLIKWRLGAALDVMEASYQMSAAYARLEKAMGAPLK